MALNILITGIGGFVGTNLVAYFQQRTDINLFGHGRNADELKKKFANARVIILDSYMDGALNAHKIDAVIHTAGIAHDISNVFKPEDYFDVNTRGTQKAYEAFLKSTAKQFLFISSVKAVIDSYSDLLLETTAPSPKTPYGKSKLEAEKFIQAQVLPPGKQFFILRPCMIHGPGNKGNLNLLYKFVKAGIPYPLGAFENKRSFLSIDNFCLYVDYILKGNVPTGIYNLADNEFISTVALYTLIARATNARPRVMRIPARPLVFFAKMLGRGGMLRKLTENMMVSNGKILQYVPVSATLKLEDGLIRTINSFRSEK